MCTDLYSMKSSAMNPLCCKLNNEFKAISHDTVVERLTRFMKPRCRNKRLMLAPSIWHDLKFPTE